MSACAPSQALSGPESFTKGHLHRQKKTRKRLQTLRADDSFNLILDPKPTPAPNVMQLAFDRAAGGHRHD